VTDTVDIFNLLSFTCFGQKGPSSEGYFYQVRKLPLQCHIYTIRDYILLPVQVFLLKPINNYLKLFTIIWLVRTRREHHVEKQTVTNFR
jgi:hypothetical protein